MILYRTLYVDIFYYLSFSTTLLPVISHLEECNRIMKNSQVLFQQYLKAFLNKTIF